MMDEIDEEVRVEMERRQALTQVILAEVNRAFPVGVAGLVLEYTGVMEEKKKNKRSVDSSARPTKKSKKMM